jgi:hypothetical protein
MRRRGAGKAKPVRIGWFTPPAVERSPRIDGDDFDSRSVSDFVARIHDNPVAHFQATADFGLEAVAPTDSDRG